MSRIFHNRSDEKPVVGKSRDELCEDFIKMYQSLHLCIVTHWEVDKEYLIISVCRPYRIDEDKKIPLTEVFAFEDRPETQPM